MLYCSWDMVCDRCNWCFLFLTIFLPFYPLTARKIKISIKWKKHPDISSFFTSVPEIMIICHTVPEIWHVTYIIVIFHFGLFFPLFQPKNQNFKKKLKKFWRYHHFTHVYHKLWLDDVRFLRYGARRTDGKSDI